MKRKRTANEEDEKKAKKLKAVKQASSESESTPERKRKPNLSPNTKPKRPLYVDDSEEEPPKKNTNKTPPKEKRFSNSAPDEDFEEPAPKKSAQAKKKEVKPSPGPKQGTLSAFFQKTTLPTPAPEPKKASPKRKSTGSKSGEDDPPKRKKSTKSEKSEEDKPKRKKSAKSDKSEDDTPKRKKSTKSDKSGEDDQPKRKQNLKASKSSEEKTSKSTEEAESKPKKVNLKQTPPKEERKKSPPKEKKTSPKARKVDLSPPKVVKWPKPSTFGEDSESDLEIPPVVLKQQANKAPPKEVSPRKESTKQTSPKRSPKQKQVTLPKEKSPRKTKAAAPPPKEPSPKKPKVNLAPSKAVTTPMVIEEETPKETRSEEYQLWAEKYRPMQFNQLVGNKAEIAKLRTWLETWEENLSQMELNISESDGKPKRGTKAAPKKAALIYGPPGVGKTTAAGIVARAVGYDPVFLNASDERNKSSMQELLLALKNTSISSFFMKSSTPVIQKKSILIMDEVDGMSSGDKGGIAELCALLPKSKIPVICLANDGEHKKLQTLSKHCTTIAFAKPGDNEILHRVRQILKLENCFIDAPTLNRIVAAAQGDFRQVLNLLQLWKNTPTEELMDDIYEEKRLQGYTGKQLKPKGDIALKDMTLGATDALPKFFSGTPLSWEEKEEAWFVDYATTPYLVQEHYTKGCSGNLEKIAQAAESISQGDIVSTYIQRKQDYDLLPFQGIVSAIIPGALLPGGGRPGWMGFPQFFGKLSKTNRHKNEFKALQEKTQTITGVTAESLALDYLPLFNHFLTQPMSAKGKEGIQDVTAFMEVYSLTIEDREAILEIDCALRGTDDAPPAVAQMTKAAFTRAWKADHWEMRQNTAPKKSPAAGTKAKAEPKKAAAGRKKKTDDDAEPKKKAPAKKGAAKKPPAKARPQLQLQFG